MSTNDERARALRWRSPVTAWLWRAAMSAFLAAGGGLLYASMAEWHKTPPKPPEVKTDVIIKNAADQQGRTASFRILLFTDEFRWRLSSHVALENGVAEPEFTPEMKAVLNSAQEVICIGTSSEEMPALPARAGRAREEWRAGRRADQIAMWVRESLSKAIPVRKLNIGQHTPTRHVRDTSDQRRVVIVLVLERDEHVEISEALRNAMAQESVRAPVFDALLKNYSLSNQPTGFTWEN